MVVRAGGRQKGPILALTVPPSRGLHSWVARSHCSFRDSSAPDRHPAGWQLSRSPSE